MVSTRARRASMTPTRDTMLRARLGLCRSGSTVGRREACSAEKGATLEVNNRANTSRGHMSVMGSLGYTGKSRVLTPTPAKLVRWLHSHVT